MPHLVGLTVLLWTRLGRAARRFERAVTQVGKAGPARALARVRSGQAALPQAAGLPRGRGWLVRELGWEAAGFGCQLEALLAEPGMQAALAEMPGVGRFLRPVCRMLGVVVPVPPGVTVMKVVAVIEAVPLIEVVVAPVWAGVVGGTVAEGPVGCVEFATII